MVHLENLLRQFYDWQGYLVRGNVKVSPLKHGGWAGELDVVAYHPTNDHLIHIEASLDSHPWAKREERFKKKFEMGKKYIRRQVFPWLDANIRLEQQAVLASSSREEVAGAKVISVDEFIKEVKGQVREHGTMSKKAIPEEYDLLRTIQLTICGYRKSL